MFVLKMLTQVLIAITHLFLYIGTYAFRNQKAARHFIHAITTSCYAIMNAYVFENFFNYNHIFDTRGLDTRVWVSSLPLTQVKFEMAFYAAHLVIELVNKEKSMIVHHAVAFIAIAFAHSYNYHHLMAATLMLLSLSTPLLALAKFAKSTKMNNAARYVFGAFAFVFFTSRVIMFPIILKTTLINGYLQSTWPPYIIINSLLVSLYIMQIQWGFKIINIMKAS